jgi:branched-subunit amino acid aminotransferase/4-amino-4-deoxychorismate lyase
VYARAAKDDPAEHGVTAATVKGLAPGDLARHKTLSAMSYAVAQQRARAAGADEALLIDADGHVLDAAGANVFLVSYAEGIFTPPASRPILAGLMRARVLAWRPDAAERDFTADELAGADGAFLTNAVLGVVPLRAVDGRPIGDGEKGDLIVDLQNQWQAWRLEVRARRGAPPGSRGSP